MLRCSLRFLSTSVACAARSGTLVMGKKIVYAVAAGRKPGIYRSWKECWHQVEGFRGNRYKGFGSEQEARSYLLESGLLDVAAPALQLEAMQVPAQAAAATAAATSGAGGEAGAACTAADGTPQLRKRRAPRAVASSGSKRRGAAPAGGGAGAAQLSPIDRVLCLEFDGASKGNPGPAGFGAVLYDEATGVEVARLCQYMGDYHTNNQAEYAGLIAGLQVALELGCTCIKVLGDSTLIIRQVLGEWQVKHEGLRPYHVAAVDLRRRFARFEARQVRREFNKAADALSNQAIVDYRSGVNRQLWTLGAAVQQAAALDAVAAALDEEALEAEQEAGPGAAAGPEIGAGKEAGPGGSDKSSSDVEEEAPKRRG